MSEADRQRSMTLDEWLAQLYQPPKERSEWFAIFGFPTSELLDQYIETIDTRTEFDVFALLRLFLISNRCHPSGDRMTLESLARAKQGRGFLTEYETRVLLHYKADPRIQTWEGITWVLDSARFDPEQALSALEAYFVVHGVHMSDGDANRMSDALAIMRAYFLGIPDSPAEAIKMLYKLGGRDFEYLICEMYRQLGYDSELTEPHTDGGRDVIATARHGGHTSNLYIECKNWAKPVGVETVRALLGAISSDKIDKGVMCAPNGFTSRGRVSAQKFADVNPQLELIGGTRLLEALTKAFGRRRWESRIDVIIAQAKAEEQRKVAQSMFSPTPKRGSTEA